ncbi:unnamed protein product [Ophioblennius macclurei]
MVDYKLTVTTGSQSHAGTFYSYIYATILGADGDEFHRSERTLLDNLGQDFKRGGTRIYTIKSEKPLGEHLIVKVEKEKLWFTIEDEWFCSHIVVTTPEGGDVLFPCHRWISSGELVELRGGKAMKFDNDLEHLTMRDHRKHELWTRNKTFKWDVLIEGISQLSSFKEKSYLPDELQFSKRRFLNDTTIPAFFKKHCSYLFGRKDWENIEAMKDIYSSATTAVSAYVENHWDDDDFFGYQFLNGINPNLIKKCEKLPPNFPVTDEMVKPSLKEGSSLQGEMEEGNIFICDLKIMDGLPGRELKGEELKMMAASLCLFYLNPAEKLMPIAIQLQQNGDENPIFLPSDKTDWRLAKMFVKNGYIIHHEAIDHLLRTHLLAESIAVATLRSFPVIHPFYKLLIPHFRYTMGINAMARSKLLGDKGIFSQCTLGFKGTTELMIKGFKETTYSSLCLPDNIEERGLDEVPNFYYRDDGLKLWEIIRSFVEKVVTHYYPADTDVTADIELQDWICMIFKRSFLKGNGFPSKFEKVEELVKFITMIIFTTTGQHAAVNNGQADFALFAPNAPFLMRKPPPTAKGRATDRTILETLPNIYETKEFLFLATALSQTFKDAVFLGESYKEHFHEHDVKGMILEFQAALSKLSFEIDKRNLKLDLPYKYLDPKQIESSIAI